MGVMKIAVGILILTLAAYGAMIHLDASKHDSVRIERRTIGYNHIELDRSGPIPALDITSIVTDGCGFGAEAHIKGHGLYVELFTQRASNIMCTQNIVRVEKTILLWTPVAFQKYTLYVNGSRLRIEDGAIVQ